MSAVGSIELDQQMLLLDLWAAAIGAADISGKYAGYLPEVPPGRTVVIGGGKGAAAMAREFDRIWPGPLSGIVVTRHGFGLAGYAGRIAVLEGGHPVPDEAGVAATARMCALLDGLTADDLVIALISGGASALLVGLPDGVTLDDKQALTRQLLSCGASITDMNVVRKHISTVKGGQLARLAGPARVVTFAVSDIPGDDIGAIGSGPTVADSSSASDARGIIARYGLALPDGMERHLRCGEEAGARAVDRPEDEAHLVVTPARSLAAAAERARLAGYDPVVLGDALEGEARDLGADHARLALSMLGEGGRICLLSGGETTVTLRGKGRGGRNTEYLLGLALALQGQAGIAALAADTDGIDGSEDNAGALVHASTLSRGSALGLDARAILAANDSYSYFEALGDLLITGPTHTNVNDFRAILIDPARAQPVAGDGA